MGNLTKVEKAKQLIQQTKPKFEELANIHGAVNYLQEASYAMQRLQENDYLAGVAISNPSSLELAVINVAAIGLTLNSYYARAYLVPRDGKVCLDISYRGYIYLATESGSLTWVQAEVVKENDVFEFNGVGQKPIHKFDPFKSNRGKVVGAYCVAKTSDGEYLTTVMSAEDLYSIRDRSASWKKNNSGPWKTDEGEMMKKTVIRRAAKTWPMTDKNQQKRISKAFENEDEVNGINFEEELIEVADLSALRGEVRGILKELGKKEEDYMPHASKSFKREINSLDDMTEHELEEARTFLSSFVKPKAVNEENKDEVA